MSIDVLCDVPNVGVDDVKSKAVLEREFRCAWLEALVELLNRDRLCVEGDHEDENAGAAYQEALLAFYRMERTYKTNHDLLFTWDASERNNPSAIAIKCYVGAVRAVGVLASFPDESKLDYFLQEQIADADFDLDRATDSARKVDLNGKWFKGCLAKCKR